MRWDVGSDVPPREIGNLSTESTITRAVCLAQTEARADRCSRPSRVRELNKESGRSKGRASWLTLKLLQARYLLILCRQVLHVLLKFVLVVTDIFRKRLAVRSKRFGFPVLREVRGKGAEGVWELHQHAWHWLVEYMTLARQNIDYIESATTKNMQTTSTYTHGTGRIYCACSAVVR